MKKITIEDRMKLNKLSFSPTGGKGQKTNDNDKSSEALRGCYSEPSEPSELIRTLLTPLPQLEQESSDAHIYYKSKSNIKRYKEGERGTFQNFLLNRKFFNDRHLVAIPAARPGGLNG